MKVLVVGYGSIGARHARILSELGCDTAVLSQRKVNYPVVFSDVKQALSVHQPTYIVIANSTNEHHKTLQILAAAGYSGHILVEKPLFSGLAAIPPNDFRSIHVGYNLRFHPVIQELYKLLINERSLSVQAYVGQYLPDWRPGVDYRSSYSAQMIKGGGVLRDLSHELDYLAWLFGDWVSMTAVGGRVSSLEIDSDDIFVLLMKTQRCPVMSLQVSYLDRVPRRQIVINTERYAIEADLLAGKLLINEKLEEIIIERDYTYREMHRALLSGDLAKLCTIDEGLATLKTIEAAEQANQRREWIEP